MNNREVVIGVCGGIAAYKTAMLVSRLVQDGTSVSVVMTESAEAFIGKATFAALTGRAVHMDSISPHKHPLGPHMELANRGELLCVAPATANFLAKAACGLGDDLLSTLYMAFRGPVVVAPAMNAQMWDKPAVQRNVQQLLNDGVTIIDPAEGWLSCRQRGAGRMAEPDVIFDQLQRSLADAHPCDNSGESH